MEHPVCFADTPLKEGNGTPRLLRRHPSEEGNGTPRLLRRHPSEEGKEFLFEFIAKIFGIRAVSPKI
jgi:hypothetical protein